MALHQNTQALLAKVNGGPGDRHSTKLARHTYHRTAERSVLRQTPGSRGNALISKMIVKVRREQIPVDLA